MVVSDQYHQHILYYWCCLFHLVFQKLFAADTNYKPTLSQFTSRDIGTRSDITCAVGFRAQDIFGKFSNFRGFTWKVDGIIVGTTGPEASSFEPVSTFDARFKIRVSRNRGPYMSTLTILKILCVYNNMNISCEIQLNRTSYSDSSTLEVLHEPEELKITTQTEMKFGIGNIFICSGFHGPHFEKIGHQIWRNQRFNPYLINDENSTTCVASSTCRHYCETRSRPQSIWRLQMNETEFFCVVDGRSHKAVFVMPEDTKKTNSQTNILIIIIPIAAILVGATAFTIFYFKVKNNRNVEEDTRMQVGDSIEYEEPESADSFTREMWLNTYANTRGTDLYAEAQFEAITQPDSRSNAGGQSWTPGESAHGGIMKPSPRCSLKSQTEYVYSGDLTDIYGDTDYTNVSSALQGQLTPSSSQKRNSNDDSLQLSMDNNPLKVKSSKKKKNDKKKSKKRRHHRAKSDYNPDGTKSDGNSDTRKWDGCCDDGKMDGKHQQMKA